MQKIFQYYGSFQNARGQWGGLPNWAKAIVGIAALPGILLAALSILVMLVSIAALLLLTVPVYQLLKGLTRPAAESAGEVRIVAPEESNSSGRRRVDATVIDPQQTPDMSGNEH